VPTSFRDSTPTPIDLGCGSGPTLRTGTSATTTRVLSPLADLLAGLPFPVQTCGSNAVSLPQGPSLLIVAPTSYSVPERLTLTRTGTPGGPVPVPVEVRTWGPVHREVQMPRRVRPALLVVDENFNAGWEASLRGRTLPAQRVDGWRQGFVVPAGARGVVSIDYTPNRPYQLALLVGLLGALGVAALAWRRPGSAEKPALATATGAGWADAMVFLLAGGLIAGWTGAVVVAAALVLGRHSSVKPAAGWIAGASVAAAGGTMALLRAHEFHPHSTAAQVAACVALAAAVVAANGPAFLRRRNGRSSR
jgi:arabinofuranan 3-O-arabinosyltransferase